MGTNPTLPERLLPGLADAEVEVVAWSATVGELQLSVRKEIGPEVGILHFYGVSHVNLAPRFTLVWLGYDDEMSVKLSLERADPSEHVYLLEEAWGATYYVVAESIDYRVVTERGAPGGSIDPTPSGKH